MGVVNLGGTPGGRVKIYDSGAIGSPQASFDISGIPQTYSSLEITIVGRGDTSAGGVGQSVTVNSDSGSNYVRMKFTANGTPTTVVSNSSSAAIIGMAAANSTAGFPGSTTVRINNYAGTTFHKVLECFGGAYIDSAGVDEVDIQVTKWANTAAITSLSFATNTGNYATGSRCAVFGIG